MNKTILHTLLPALALTLAACESDFDINKLHDEPSLLVYCFPTEGDTTVVSVYRTVPVAADVTDHGTQAVGPADAHVTYKVNGQELTVRRITADDCARLSTDSLQPARQLEGHYMAIGPQRAGDQVSLEVKAEGMPAATAATHIPHRVEATIDSVIEKPRTSDSWYSVNRVEATFSDNAAARDYYMVRLSERCLTGQAVGSGGIHHDEFMAQTYDTYMAYRDAYEHWDFSQLQWNSHLVPILTEQEPVFENCSQLDQDFGYDPYTYTDGAYFFGDRLFNGQTYTLRLDVYKNAFTPGSYHNFGDWDGLAGAYFYTLQFYTLTEEYYRFIKTKTDNDNNTWAMNGLTSPTPLYTNVHGGLGVVAGYAACMPARRVPVSNLQNPMQ